MPNSNQPTSFRFPFDLEGVDPKIKGAVRYSFTGLKDLNDAIRELNTKVNTNTAKVTTVQQAINAITGAPPAPSFPAFGNVNLQPNLTPGAYTTAQSDFGGLILVQSTPAFALTLDSGLMVPFFTTVYNLGAGTVTMTPTLGQVNNAASVTVPTNELAIVFFDGTNWWAAAPTIPSIFSLGGTILTPTAPVNAIVWFAPFSATVTNVLGYTSGTTGSVVNARRNGSLKLLAGDLILGSADTWLDGGAVQNTAISAGDKVEIMLISLSGLPSEIAVEVQYTRP